MLCLGMDREKGVCELEERSVAKDRFDLLWLTVEEQLAGLRMRGNALEQC